MAFDRRCLRKRREEKRGRKKNEREIKL